MTINELHDAVALAVANPELIAWHDLGEGGGTCIDWKMLPTDEMLEISLTRALIEAIMPKTSDLWERGGKRIAAALGLHHVTYPWATSALARLLGGLTMEQYLDMLVLSRIAQRAKRATTA